MSKNAAKRGTRKRKPDNIIVFGATGHMGRPLARHARFLAPDVELRLVTSDSGKAESLAQEFPESRYHVANLFEAASLEPVLEGAQAVFIVTPSPFDEATAMANFIDVARHVSDPVHIVRIVGFEPESLPRRVPENIRAWGGTAQQHYVAKRLLDESDLPVTYLNVGATYLDNFLNMAPIIRDRQMLIYPKRLIPFIDARDIGEIAANLMLSPDERHLYQFLTLNNGHDLLSIGEVVETISDVLKTRIGWISDRESFLAEFGEAMARRRGRPDAAAQVLDFMEYEQGNSAFLHLSDVAERLLGRKPVTLRAWLMEHRHHFLPAC